ncbi:hypothetical protein Gasu2_41960 [Galdieria sulphuraria]|uniref:Uncharacterized protein n=1 Tax=Galdieria sulphuraria TaxID=130081 RepID=M2XWI1_GALSU|nr:uncharacterized protein Gasu_44780 [Galdieria sulphuraria]EME27973.1 hypothetical protein Gasu_44780 [Galdieria sulphuraria]GJD09975.1 hypothetical protein Gasu2_41960 [Galdieria sulphuraria]|eukprot:XP_005704493.1 hypothetical protein Gasu_44780 [Galdieria sulphuraria]
MMKEEEEIIRPLFCVIIMWSRKALWSYPIRRYSSSNLEKEAKQLTSQLLNVDWLSKDLQLIHQSNQLLSKYRSVYNTPEGKPMEATMRQLYQAKEAARIGAALSLHIENLLSKVMTSLGPFGNHVLKKDGYEDAVKETIQVYDEMIEKLSGDVKQKAIDNLSQRIIQLRQTVHVNNFSCEFYPVAGDHLQVDGVEKKKKD